jgi:hypothetical protein
MKQPNANLRLTVILRRASGGKRKQMLEMRQARMIEPQDFDSRAAGLTTFGDRLSRRLWHLRSETLCAGAMRQTGLEDFGKPDRTGALDSSAP